MQLSFQNRWQVVARCGSALLLFQYCGCAHLATVKTIPARLATGLHVEEPLDSGTKYLLAAEHEQPLPALGHDLLAAKISYAVLERHPKNESARSIYNFAVARVVQDVERFSSNRFFPLAYCMKVRRIGCMTALIMEKRVFLARHSTRVSRRAIRTMAGRLPTMLSTFSFLCTRTET